MNIKLAVFSVGIALLLAQCNTAEKKVPPCGPNKVYPAIYPPVCEPIKKETGAAKCPKTRRLGLPYTTIDEANYRIAVPRCAQLFPVSPCLKVFAKVAENTYRAICSAPDGMGKQELFDVKDRSK